MSSAIDISTSDWKEQIEKKNLEFMVEFYGEMFVISFAKNNLDKHLKKYSIATPSFPVSQQPQVDQQSV